MAEDDVAKTENQGSRKARSAEAARDRGRQHGLVLAFRPMMRVIGNGGDEAGSPWC